MLPKQIAKATNKNDNTVRGLLQRMLDADLVTRGDHGEYRAV
jgi:DNA-binding IclR family transcriptional regulator